MQHFNEVKPRFVVNEAIEQVAYADRIILNKVNYTFTVASNSIHNYSVLDIIIICFILFCIWQTDLVTQTELEKLIEKMKVCVSVEGLYCLSMLLLRGILQYLDY